MSYPSRIAQYNKDADARMWNDAETLVLLPGECDPVTGRPYIGTAVSATGIHVKIMAIHNYSAKVVYPKGTLGSVLISGLTSIELIEDKEMNDDERPVQVGDLIKSRFSGKKGLVERVFDSSVQTSFARVNKKDIIILERKHNQEEQPMSKYGNQSHDQIFEALVEKQFYTVLLNDKNHNCVGSYRVYVGVELKEGDHVIAEASQKGKYSPATVAEVLENKCSKACKWVVQKMDPSAHLERQEAWTKLYEGIKTTEMEKKRAIIANGYEKELQAFAPEAAAILTGFSTPQLTKAQSDVVEGKVE